MNTEKEWHREYQTAGIVAGQQQWVVDEGDLPKLLAEQKKRDWAEFREIVAIWILHGSTPMELAEVVDSKIKEL